MKKNVIKCGLTFLFAIGSMANLFAWNYPVDTGFEKIATIGTEDLYGKYKAGQVIIVDVRSKIEYETTHVKNSVHIPVGNKSFASKLKSFLEELLFLSKCSVMIR